MPSAHLTLKEEDAIRLILEFLSNRELSISQLSLERETGIINGVYSNDVLFLRQLILDGQWDDVLEFIQPLESLESFDSKQFHYIVIKHKYIELLCIRSEAGLLQNLDVAVEEVVKCLNELEQYCPSKEDYNNLCLLLTFPRLSDHFDFKNWNPSNARVNCFKAVYPLVEKFLPLDRKVAESQKTGKGDRLIQLIIKGILYESCVEYCQQRATSSSTDTQEMHFASLLNGTGFSDSDLSLLSWLQCIPPETFSYPFEQKTLNVDVEQLEKPCLEASWSEQILVTPIKPKIFPHSATPFTRLRTSDVMTRSLTPNLDGLGLHRSTMAFSMCELSSAMSRSFAGFHLTGKKAMNTSVDRLFEGGDVFSASCTDLPVVLEKPQKSPEKKSPRNDGDGHATTKLDMSRKNADGIQADQLKLNCSTTKLAPIMETSKTSSGSKGSDEHSLSSSMCAGEQQRNSDLWKEFQRQKQQLWEQLQAAERQKEETLNGSTVSSISSPGQKSTVSDSCDANEGVDVVDSTVTPTPSQGVHRYPQLHQQRSSTPKSPSPRQYMQTPHTSPLLAQGNVVNSDRTPHRPVASIGKSLNSAFETNSIPGSIMQPQVISVDATARPPGMNPYGGMPSYSQMPPQSYRDSSANPSLVDPSLSYRSSPHQPPGMMSSNMRHAHKPAGSGVDDDTQVKKPHFIPVTRLEDAQAIRAAEFHPSGQLYAIGSNSKTLRICTYPKLNDLREDHVAHQPTVLFKRLKHHKGSIYCLAWNGTGDLLATGSNDKTIKLMRFNAETCNIEGQDSELSMHDGTVRDMIFIEDMSNKSSLLISGGAGDCKIYVTDCETATPFQALSGHSGHILSLYTWGGAMFVSGSQDRTIRFWDLRTRGCVNLVTAPPASGSGPGSPVAAVCVDPSGRMLVSGQEDASCMLYDIRGGRMIQSFRPHTSDIRTIRFSPKAYYLLTGSYDHKIVLTDLQGDLTQPLPSVVVAEHADKVIQGRWHPRDFSFLTTSADKTATLWALPAN